jgi:hypothetical protein
MTAPPDAPPARLVIVRGMSHGTLRAVAGASALLDVASRGKAKGPKVDADGTSFRVRFEHGWPWQRSSSVLSLSTRVAWEIDVRGGVSDVKGELEGLTLASLSISGGLSDVELDLGVPKGTCTVRLVGGASHWVVRRPRGVGARLSILGGASRVALDESFFEAVGGKLRMESHDYAAAEGRYHFEILGGVSHLVIATAS